VDAPATEDEIGWGIGHRGTMAHRCVVAGDGPSGGTRRRRVAARLPSRQ
jgi:hypothetical protein